ncbi:hypothetical protein ACOSP7_011313 [Xanthoceras sorbifolium]
MAYRPNKRFPQFLKLHSPEHTSHRLHVPDDFVTFCNRLLPKKAVLSNDMGKVWHVDVNHVDNGVFFLDGWRKFVKDNSLEGGDLLVFKYNGDCGFSVKIFGSSACEKIASGANGGAPYMNAAKLEKDEEEEDTTKEKEEEATIKKSRDVKQSGGSNGGSKKGAAVEVEKEAATIKVVRARKRSSENNGIPKKRVVFEIEEEEEVEEENIRNWKKSSGGCEKLQTVNVKGGSKRTTDAKFVEFDMRKYIQHGNLYFTAKERAGPIHYSLYVPKNISKALKLSGHVSFRNKHGGQWSGIVSNVKKEGKIYISGWKCFCRMNHVGPDDLCVCEFLQDSNQMGNIIQVHIIGGSGSGS